MSRHAALAVVIACHNYETFVGRAIKSVLDQRAGNCELVVVDDGSTDGSWDAIRQFDVPAFRIGNCGQRKACLFGLERTQAPFILFLDADDELRPDALARITERLDQHVAKLQFSLRRIDAFGNVISGPAPSLRAFRGRSEIAHQVLRTGVYRTPPTSGNVFRRDVCDLLREADYDTAVDGIILFAAPFFGDIVSVSEALGYYRIHDRNDSGLGRGLEPRLLDREITRFLARTEHLREFLRRFGLHNELISGRDAFYYRERSFCLGVASGSSVSRDALVGLLSKLIHEPFSAGQKIAMVVFFLLAAMLPNAQAKALMNYRCDAGSRSALRLAKQMVSRRQSQMGLS